MNTPEQAAEQDGPDERVLELTYERIAGERDRIRNARTFFTGQLGPVPVVVAGSLAVLVTVVREDDPAEVPLGLAIAVLVLTIALSWWSSQRKPYRKLRVKAMEDLPDGSEATTAAEWYTAEIALENAIYTKLAKELERERWAVFAVHGLFLVALALLVVSIA